MNRPTRALPRALPALLLAVCLSFSGLLAAVALAAPGTTESEAALRQQVSAKQVQSARINKRERTVRVTLKDGTQAVARYPKKQSEATAKRLEAAGVKVTVLTPAEAAKEGGTQAKKSHHKLRYIAGAVVIVAILLGVAALFYIRRRGRD